jgi:hypothetical protein
LEFSFRERTQTTKSFPSQQLDCRMRGSQELSFNVSSSQACIVNAQASEADVAGMRACAQEERKDLPFTLILNHMLR